MNFYKLLKNKYFNRQLLQFFDKILLWHTKSVLGNPFWAIALNPPSISLKFESLQYQYRSGNHATVSTCTMQENGSLGSISLIQSFIHSSGLLKASSTCSALYSLSLRMSTLFTTSLANSSVYSVDSIDFFAAFFQVETTFKWPTKLSILHDLNV
jgi:hypothetical protein